MKAKPYQAKSITGAQAYVRMLLKQRGELLSRVEQYAKERRVLAMLAADGPAFDNPLVVMQAKCLRDQILEHECKLKPDGSPLP